MPVGPIKYDTQVKPNLDKIREWAKQTNETEIRKRLGISSATWIKYKKEFPELQDALLSKQDLVSEIKNALVKRALGFEYTESKTVVRKTDTGEDILTTEIYKKYSPPDVAACNSLLQNMTRDWYRDRAQYELKKKQIELQKKQLESKEF